MLQDVLRVKTLQLQLISLTFLQHLPSVKPLGNHVGCKARTGKNELKN